jgi:hypothetical protein
MLALNSRSVEPKVLIDIDEFSHLATLSLNSLEYLTAATLGMAKDYCETSSIESVALFASNRSWSGEEFISMTQDMIFSDFGKLVAHLDEILHDYFEYVDSDLRRSQ